MSCYKENHKGFFSIKEKTNFTSPLPYYETYATRCSYYEKTSTIKHKINSSWTKFFRFLKDVTMSRWTIWCKYGRPDTSVHRIKNRITIFKDIINFHALNLKFEYLTIKQAGLSWNKNTFALIKCWI